MDQSLLAGLHLGASWYPEMWPEEEWPGDVAKMQELGFTVTRLFEFAWHRFEPEEGRYDFGWALKVLDLLHDAGIKAMLGTPTAAPPAWLTSTYPEVLKTKPDGSRYHHGGRHHYNVHSRLYRQLCRKLVVAMADTLGRHPAVSAWQIDNEMNGYDYGPETAAHFHAWLKRRYRTVQELNRLWGLEFWSQAYDSFEQVPLCTAEVGSIEVPERNHPSLILAIARFQNEGWHDFIGEQCSAIRERCDHLISTNQVGTVGAMDWPLHHRHLDVVGSSMYSDRRYYHQRIIAFDFLRARKPDRPYWLLETAPNWSGGGRTWNIHFDAQGVRMFTWLTCILGGNMVLYWQWREHWAGQEMIHGTCVTASGKWRPNREAWAKLGTEYRRHGAWFQAHPPARAKLALVISATAGWIFSVDPTDEDMSYGKRLMEHAHLPLARAHLWRDVIAENADPAPYAVICMPYLPILPRAIRARLEDWVRGGGTLILGPLTGYRTEELTVPHPQEFDGLESLIGGESALRFTVQWVEDQVWVEFADGTRTRSKTLCEAYEPTSATVIARYHGGYGHGLPAALEHRLGTGRVITLGCIIDDATWAHLVGKACADAGITPIATGDPEVVVVPRAGTDGRIAGYGLANLAGEAKTVTLPKGGRDLLSDTVVPATVTMDPFGVKVVVC